MASNTRALTRAQVADRAESTQRFDGEGGLDGAFFTDSRPESMIQRRLNDTVIGSPQVKHLNSLSSMFNSSPRVVTQLALAKVAQKSRKDSLPMQLQAGVEALSGIRMDQVRVHYNSSKPAQVKAHAFAQGSDIHIGSGQERHLPHEAWHVVQQARGQVQPTARLQDGSAVNDSKELEQEADVMGAQAMQLQTGQTPPLSDAAHAGVSDDMPVRQLHAPNSAPTNTASPIGNTTTSVWPEANGNFARNVDGSGGSLDRVGALEAIIPKAKTAPGRPPSADPLGWRWLYTMVPKIKGHWVRFHLLNEQLGGKGDDTDLLVPTSHADNTGGWLHNFEQSMKTAHAKNALHYRIELDYHAVGTSGSAADYNRQFFPSSIRAAYRTWDQSNMAWSKVKLHNGANLHQISAPPSVSGTVQKDIDKVSENQLTNIWGIEPKLINMIKRVRSNGGFTSVTTCQELYDLLMGGLFTTEILTKNYIDRQFNEEKELLSRNWPLIAHAVTGNATGSLLVNGAILPPGAVNTKDFAGHEKIRKDQNALLSDFIGLPRNVASAICHFQTEDFIDENKVFYRYIDVDHVVCDDGGTAGVLRNWRMWMETDSKAGGQLPIRPASKDPAETWSENLAATAINHAFGYVAHHFGQIFPWEDVNSLQSVIKEAIANELTKTDKKSKLSQLLPTELQAHLNAIAQLATDPFTTRRRHYVQLLQYTNNCSAKVSTLQHIPTINNAWPVTLRKLNMYLNAIQNSDIEFEDTTIHKLVIAAQKEGSEFFTSHGIR